MPRFDPSLHDRKVIDLRTKSLLAMVSMSSCVGHWKESELAGSPHAGSFERVIFSEEDCFGLDFGMSIPSI